MKPFYRPELDMLRFFAFFAVFCSHALPTASAFYSDKLHLPHSLAWLGSSAASAGGSGVVLFFMLSSYLITGLLVREQNKTGSVNVLAFYKRRALRIWPLYFAFLLVAGIAFPLFGWHWFTASQWTGFGSFTANWILPHADNIGMPPVGALWSVSVEEQFYLLWPLIFILVGIASLPFACWAIVAGALVARYFMVSSGSTETQIWYSTFSHMDSIAVGALLAHACRNRLPQFIAPARLALICAGIMAVVVVRGLPDVYRYPLTTAGCALVLLGVLGCSLPVNSWTRALIYLGKISFGLYVFHGAWIYCLDAWYPKLVLVFPLAMIGSIATAALSYRYLETPFLNLKQKLSVVESRPA